MFLKLTGFAPDSEQVSPGVIMSIENMVPSFRGYKGAPEPVDQGVASLSETCVGVVSVRLSDDTVRVIAGTSSKLRQRTGTTWTDRSEGTYTLGASSRWRFAQLGDVTLAAAREEVLQAMSLGSSSFSAVSGAPQASVIATVLDFVMVGNTNDASFSDSPQRVMWANVGGLNFVPRNANTQAGTDVLTDIPGGLTALHALGDQAVVYKNQGMHLGTYEGPPFIWTFATIPGSIGAPSQEAVVNVGTAHIFFGYEGIYIFDGVRPQRISTGLDEWLYVTELDRSYAHFVSSLHDRRNARIYFYYPRVGGNGALNGAVVLNYRAMKWGVDHRTVQFPFELLTGQTTIDGMDALASTINSLPAIAFDDPYWSQFSTVPAYIGANGKLNVLNGPAGAFALEVGDYGLDGQISIVKRIRPRFASTPVSASLVHRFRDDLGASHTATGVALTSGKADVIVAARWHRDRLACSGSAEVYGFDVEIEPDGEE